VLRRLTAVDVPSELDDVEQDDLVPVDEWVEFQLEDTEGLCGQAPTVDDLRSAVGDPVAETVAERWLLDWELAHCPDAGLDDPASYLSWFEPGEGVKIMLSPRPEPWSAAVYAGHYGNDWPDSDLRPALVRDWCVRYGAEPVANWETMQQFVIRRPPATLDQAWEVARAQALLWPDTYRLPGVNVRQMARDLVGRDRWFLHLRP
jgi:hypothetical protein